MMTKRKAIKMMLGLLFAVLIFHLLIIMQIIPYEITWGGRLKSEQEMYVFESISIIINLLLGFVLLMQGDYIKRYFKQIVINIILWFFLVLFILNTIGNMLAKTYFEKSFAVFTLTFAILIVILLKNKTPDN